MKLKKQSKEAESEDEEKRREEKRREEKRREEKRREEKRREEKRREEKKQSKKKENTAARKSEETRYTRAKCAESRETLRFCNVMCGSAGSKSRLAKGAGAEVAVQRRNEKLHSAVARSTFASQNVQNTPFSDHFLKWGCRKMARRCGAKYICKSKCQNHLK